RSGRAREEQGEIRSEWRHQFEKHSADRGHWRRLYFDRRTDPFRARDRLFPRNRPAAGVSNASRLSAEDLTHALRGRTIGSEVRLLEEITSTNDAILEQTSVSTPEGLTIFAERQTAGRGQRANRWESAQGKGLWFSILLRPKIDVGESARLAE